MVGRDLLTIPESTGHKLWYPFLAARLSEYLEVNSDDLPEGAELNEVACRYLKKDSNNKPRDISAALKKVSAEAESWALPKPLLQLAAINPIELFVSTTFDSLLARALNQIRFGGNSKTRVYSHSPNEVEDIPGDLPGLGVPVIYQLMGKLSATPSFAVTQDDYVDFFHSLQAEKRPKQLFHELSNRSLLLIGTRLSGWLTSFLMRMARGEIHSRENQAHFVADGNDKNLVLFLEHFSSSPKIFCDSDPVAFVDELYQRWTDGHPATGHRNTLQGENISLPSDRKPGAVFLSYASEDLPVVEKLKSALDEAGVEAFFDQDELQGGVAWTSKLRRNINECCLFVPVISRRTLTPEERFFRKEWRQALEKASMASFSPDDVFLLPVVIDDTTRDAPRLPDEFRVIQWTSLPGGEPTPAFVERVKQLYRKRQLELSGGV